MKDFKTKYYTFLKINALHWHWFHEEHCFYRGKGSYVFFKCSVLQRHFVLKNCSLNKLDYQKKPLEALFLGILGIPFFSCWYNILLTLMQALLGKNDLVCI